MSEDRTRDSVPFAARHGLVRPLQGRYVAGVCAALAKATRTDPVLWRVGLAVLICFGGVGALIYLLTWLLTPEEGDTASPAEAMIGRGQSNTSPVLTGALGLIVAGLLIFVLSRPQYLVLGGAVVLAIALLINKVSNEPPPTGPPPGDPPAGGPTPPPTDAPPADAPPAGPVPADGLAATPTDRPPADAVPAATGGGDTVTEPVRAAAAEPAGASATDPANATEPAGATEPGTTLTEPWQQPTRPIPPASPLPSLQPPPFSPPPGTPYAGYRPPFAPHGPFSPPAPAPARPPKPPRPPRERSALPAIVFFSTLVVLGGLGSLDLTGAIAVPPAGYLAAALAVIGAGLVVGTWLGRGRSLIALGTALALALPVAHVAEVWERPEYVAGDFHWRPADLAEMEDRYSVIFSSAELDLTGVDFTDQAVDLTVENSFSDFTVVVPGDVAVQVDVSNRFSNTTVFGQPSDGLSRDRIRDPGSGDPADGTLRLDVQNRFGNVTVMGR